MGDFRKLEVWREGHQLALDVYRISQEFPPDERYGLTAQVRRAAASISANIAEGAGRNSPRDFARFCRIALGSANEVDNHLILALDLNYIEATDQKMLEARLSRIRRMLATLVARLTPPDEPRNSR